MICSYTQTFLKFVAALINFEALNSVIFASGSSSDNYRMIESNQLRVGQLYALDENILNSVFKGPMA